MSWKKYVLEVIETDQQQTAAAKAGVNQSTMSRWISTGVPGRAENVIKLARAYKRPVAEALVAAGFLTAEEAKVRPAAAPDYSQLTNDELLELVRTRMRQEGGGRGGDTAATIRPSGPHLVPTANQEAANETAGDEMQQPAGDPEPDPT